MVCDTPQDWVPNKPPVDRSTCSCSCFDTVFRGSYENPGNVGYKHLYFNTTANMAKMWLLTVVFLLLFYESLRYLYKLWQRSCSVRWGFLLLYVIQLYPHYYSWWSFLMYYNEEVYSFFTHHFVFMVTELLSTVIVLVLANAKNPLNHRQIGVVGIGLTHVLVAGLDQFVAHLIRGQGKAFQNARNIGLMVPDLVHVIIPSLYYYRHMRSTNAKMFDDRSRREIILLLLLVTGGVLCGRVLFP
ncbi:uncharacterized protein LOC112572096 [Pomacea canaliculata]|uniref:uncharacterized protein LOC112572096 n=1 Tax=Pomacea canaliculata TaxID=400727 RepID=UPI000D72D570|nr:uncharacterized protein LOC112572096 [Pomacea canaliculata]